MLKVSVCVSTMDENTGKDEPTHQVSDNLPDNKPSSPKPADIEAGEIPQDEPSAMDESSRLRELQADVRNQDDLERDITREVCSLLRVTTGTCLTTSRQTGC